MRVQKTERATTDYIRTRDRLKAAAAVIVREPVPRYSRSTRFTVHETLTSSR